MSRKISKEELAADVIRVCKEYNNYSLQNYKEHGKFCQDLFYKYFGGGWRKVCKELNLKPELAGSISKEELDADIIRVFEETGCTKQRNYIHYGKFSRAAIKRIYGSWNKMLRANGYQVNMTKPGQYTRQDIIDDYNRVKQDYGYAPSAKEYRKSGRFSQTIIDSMFGSYTELKRLIGDRIDGKFISDEEILEDLKRIHKEFGIIGEDLLSAECLVSYPTILARFGSMPKACELAGVPYVPPDNRHSKLCQQCLTIIKNILGDDYELEKTFPWLRNNRTRRHLFIDIYYPKYKLAIEIDGGQHYDTIGHSADPEKLESLQHRDRLKRFLCIINGIELIRFESPNKKEITQALSHVA